jgi:phosphotransferase system  glucose/maltose/N-acetylglucosamine-specific IIC component
VRAWLIRVVAVEVINNLTGMLQVLSRFLSQVIITGPLNSILQTGVTTAMVFPTGIHNFFYLPFLESINFNRWGQVVFLSVQRVFSNRVEQANMEHRVDLHRGRQVQLICMWADNLGNAEWSKVFLI